MGLRVGPPPPDLRETVDRSMGHAIDHGMDFQNLAEASVDGLVVLHGTELHWANQAAATILGGGAATLDEAARCLLSAVQAGATGPPGSPGARGTRTVVTLGQGPERRLELDVSSRPIGGDRVAVWFRDLGEQRAQQDRITALATAALGVADTGSLDTTLNALATEVREAADLAAVQVVTMHNDGPILRIVGRAGFTEDEDFSDRLEQARANGAHLELLSAVEARRPVIVPHRKERVLGDQRWAPMHHLFAGVDWDCFGAFPLVVRDRPVGVLIAFFRPGDDPDNRTIEFLSAMADQAALAVDYAALIAISRDEARRRERERIATDLHDSVVQQVFSMRLLVRAMEASCDTEERVSSDDVRRTAGELVSLCRHTLADLRDLIFELRPTDLIEHGLADAVKVHAHAIEARTGLLVDTEVDPAVVVVGADAQEDIYRIVQEALHNAVKHADATRVVVRITAHDDEFVEVTVTDDGRGLPLTPSAAAHVGLTSMRERARKCGGSLAVSDAPEGGVLVRAIMPVGATVRPVTTGPGRRREP